jgi:hypothetical protein
LNSEQSSEDTKNDSNRTAQEDKFFREQLYSPMQAVGQ